MRVTGDATNTSGNLVYGNSGDGLDVSGYEVFVLNNIISTNGGMELVHLVTSQPYQETI
ncbi:hypothetical protein [Methanobacterium paludis]|uniref:hypothetical protein n=1 Tax=Methanobacterium paludis (strain DSM 25820 / JCM 18151 / SWAN1) TaxID=868131 RepID=UPI00373AF51D